MKKIYLVMLGVFFLIQAQAQKSEGRQLIWSIGEVELTRGTEVQVTYPIMVAISEDSNTPQLGTSTMRLFYDAGQLNNLAVKSVANNYQVSGLNLSNDVFGDIFGFVGGGGIFAQFNLMANQQNLLKISKEPVHVMDLSFTVAAGARLPLCAPLVLDNHSKGAKSGSEKDTGFLMNDGGISGTYHLNGKANTVFMADDEVNNYLWERSAYFDQVVDHVQDIAGNTVRLKAKTCLEPQKPVLPAEIDLFDAWKEAKDKVRINWKTLSEFNNDFFDIQRSGDGFSFETIGTVYGQWNSVEPINYEFQDQSPLPGINYYRLVQVDKNGRTSFSSVKEVEFDLATDNQTETWKVAYYPNPSRGMVHLSSNQVFTNLDLEIYDADGRIVMKKNNISSDGPLDLTRLSAGIYSLTLLDLEGQIKDTQQIVIVAE